MHETLEDAWRHSLRSVFCVHDDRFDPRTLDIEYRPGDVSMFGPESVGLPAEVQQDPHDRTREDSDEAGRRSLNLANSASIAILRRGSGTVLREEPSSMATAHHNLPGPLVQQILETRPPPAEQIRQDPQIGSSRSRVWELFIRRHLILVMW